MDALVQFGRSINAVVQRMRTIRCAALVVVAALSGCATLGRSTDSATPAATAEGDAQRAAGGQAALAVERAESAERQGETNDAVRYYEQAQTLDPSLVHLSRRLAVLYDERGDDARARAAYEEALQLQPDDPDLLNDFGVFHLHRAEWAAAETWFRRALTVAPAHQRAMNNVAMALAMQNRTEESYETFAQVVGPAAAHSNLGVLLTRQGRLDEARERFRQALALDPTMQPAGEFLSRLDRDAEARAVAGSNPSAPSVGDQAEALR